MDTMYTVIVVRGGRMYPCEHKHETPDEAHQCARDNEGISIMEWIKDRNPQFSEFWRSPEHSDA
jgi:hypothetical protein